MAERTEYQALLTLKRDLEEADALEEKIKKCDDDIQTQQERKNNLPYYNDPKHKETQVKEYKDDKVAIHALITVGLAVLFLIHAIVKTSLFAQDIGEGIGFLLTCLVGMIGLVLGFSYPILGFTHPTLGFLVSTLQFLVGGWFYGGFEDNPLGPYLSGFVPVMAICTGLSLVVTVIVDIVHKKKHDIDLKEAEAMDKAAREEYEKGRKEKEAKIDQEAPQIIAVIEKQKDGYKTRLAQIKAAIRNNDILGAQDKNLYTVNSLISYFDRKRVSSVKEGINLFLQEQRLNDLERESRAAQFQQQIALKRMEEEQEYHNEQMRKLERERNKKIEDALNEVKYK